MPGEDPKIGAMERVAKFIDPHNLSFCELAPEDGELVAAILRLAIQNCRKQDEQEESHGG